MKSTIETQELNEDKELLTYQYQEAMKIVDIKGNEYIDEYLNEDDAIRFKELVDTVFDYYDVLETVDKYDIDDWNDQLEEYLNHF